MPGLLSARAYQSSVRPWIGQDATRAELNEYRMISPIGT